VIHYKLRCRALGNEGEGVKVSVMCRSRRDHIVERESANNGIMSLYVDYSIVPTFKICPVVIGADIRRDSTGESVQDGDAHTP